MASFDPKDDVDRLFVCFKCGVSPPRKLSHPSTFQSLSSSCILLLIRSDMVALESALREMNRQGGKKSRIVADGEASRNSSSPDAVKRGLPTSAATKAKSCKQMSPIVFYGSPQGVPVKRPLSLLRLLREIHVDLKKQNELIQRDVVWATFPRQEEAMRFSKAHSHVNIFSYQDHLTGQRRFLVSTYNEFWRRYKNMGSKFRHHYEVIQEGSPCHLYFDLEYDTRFNTKRNVDEMVDILVGTTFTALYEKYSIEGSEEWIIELDSSTKEKFSRHLIIRIPKTAFKDNSHVGAFVSEVCSRISTQRGTNPKLDKLYIAKDGSCANIVDQLFLDTAVYSRNRCFRLAFSSKSGKSSFLLPTGRFKCGNMNEKEVFMESLICRLDDDCDKLLTCKMDLDCKKILHFDSELSTAVNQERSLKTVLNSYRSDFPTAYMCGKSPFPALDAFIESVGSAGNVSGKIRCWYWFSQYGLMVYNMSRSRYCEHIGREHKSNHVMYIVDFQRAAYYQKCYDPDCQGYRSPLRPVPWDVIPEHSSIVDSARAEYQMEARDICFDHNEIIEYQGDGKSMTDSGHKDYIWWQEAVRFADSIERMEHPLGSCNLDDDSCEDSEWWIDAEKLVSQIEGRITSQSNV